jgi:hypothetical protein
MLIRFKNGGDRLNNLLETVKAVLSTTPARWSSMTEILPENLLTRNPLPNEWSAMDCLCHLLDTERWIFPLRVQALLAGENFVALLQPLILGSGPWRSYFKDHDVSQ